MAIRLIHSFFQMATINPNQDICDMLIKLGEYERDINGVIYKYHAYKKASNALATMDKRVKSANEAIKLPGIGPKIAAKIEEFLQGDSEDISLISSSKENTKKERKKKNKNSSLILSSNFNDLKIIDNYEKLFMTNLDAIRMQINQITTIGQLKDKINLLKPLQIICLEHFKDLCKPIPREETENFVKYITKVVEVMSNDIKIIICGSFRRGIKESDRIDILMVHSKLKSSQRNISNILNDCLIEIVQALEEKDIIKKRLSVDHDTFVGLAQIKSFPFRLVRLYLIPQDCYVCRLLYLTGSRTFFDQIAQHALTKGFVVEKDSLRKIGYTCVIGQPIHLESEENLFQYIQHPFVKPEERSIAC